MNLEQACKTLRTLHLVSTARGDGGSAEEKTEHGLLRCEHRVELVYRKSGLKKRHRFSFTLDGKPIKEGEWNRLSTDYQTVIGSTGPKRKAEQNVWGNWNGYEGNRKVAEFGTDDVRAGYWVLTGQESDDGYQSREMIEKCRKALS